MRGASYYLVIFGELQYDVNTDETRTQCQLSGVNI